MRGEGGGGETHLGICFHKVSTDEKALEGQLIPLPFLRSLSFFLSHKNLGFTVMGILTAGLNNFTICDRIANPPRFLFSFLLLPLLQSITT